ncbi:hypothetical protein GCM10010295_58630 [Streptomyces intermedius]
MLGVSAGDHLGHVSTVSAYPVLPAAERAEVFRRMARVLPEVAEMDAGRTVHLARRCEERGGWSLRRGHRRASPAPPARPCERSPGRWRVPVGAPGAPGAGGGRVEERLVQRLRKAFG